MRSGRLHRYGETGGSAPEPSLLEQEYAAYVGAKYCVAMNSCGATLFVALKTLGVVPGDKVLTSTFTLAPVPGAIAHAGADPVLVETTASYTTDLADLERKAASSGANVFLISHMRGHITDMQTVRAICDAHRGGRRLRPHHGRALGRPRQRHLGQDRLLQHPDLQAHQFG